MADVLLQFRMDLGNSTLGLADRGGGPYFSATYFNSPHLPFSNFFCNGHFVMLVVLQTPSQLDESNECKHVKKGNSKRTQSKVGERHVLVGCK